MMEMMSFYAFKAIFALMLAIITTVIIMVIMAVDDIRGKARTKILVACFMTAFIISFISVY